MPILSHLHDLFSTEGYQAYIHMLRWTKRPFQCPRCDRHHVSLWDTSHSRPWCTRYWCHGCKRTFNDLTNTMMHQSQRSLPHWILASFLLWDRSARFCREGVIAIWGMFGIRVMSGHSEVSPET